MRKESHPSKPPDGGGTGWAMDARRHTMRLSPRSGAYGPRGERRLNPILALTSQASAPVIASNQQGENPCQSALADCNRK
jgi:hypothetical protein